MGNPHGAIEVVAWAVDLRRHRAAILSPEEAQRAARLRSEEDRTRWSHAHSALRTILGEMLGRNPRDLAFTTGEHGKPELRDDPGLHFNLSHSHDYALIAVSRAAPVGVDIERIRPQVDMAALLRRIGEDGLPCGEFALFERWALREAATKAAGGPLMRTPPASVRAWPIAAPDGYAAALAVDCREPIGDIIVQTSTL